MKTLIPRCPSCNNALEQSVQVCEYCDSPVVITSFSTLGGMSAPKVNKYANAYKDMISEISRVNPKLNIVTSVKKYMDEVANKNLKEMLQKDILATNIYTMGYEMDSWANLDYTNKLIVM